MKTCMKLGVPFFAYLGDRLGIPAEAPVPLLPDLVRKPLKLDCPAICPAYCVR